MNKLNLDHRLFLSFILIFLGTLMGSALPSLSADCSADFSVGLRRHTYPGYNFSDGYHIRYDPQNCKILVAGRVTPSANNTKLALFRFNPDLTKDTTFGTNGVSVLNIAGFASGWDLRIQPDGKIVVSGLWAPDYQSTNTDFFIARFDENGTLDTTFGTGGYFKYDFGGGDYSFDVELAGNQILAQGSYYLPPDDGGINLIRLTSEGMLDTNFGTGGVVQVVNVDHGNTDNTEVAALPNGQILGGYGASSPGRIRLVLFNSNGAEENYLNLDKPNLGFIQIHDIKVESMNNITVAYAGAVCTGGRCDQGWITGTLTLSAEGNSLTLLDEMTTPPEFFEIFGQLIDSSNRLLSTGKSGADGNQTGWRIQRSLPTGSYDTSFSGDGIVDHIELYPDGNPNAWDAVELPDGKYVVLGVSKDDANTYLTLLSMRPDGTWNSGLNPGTLGFDPAAYTVNENGGQVTFKVKRVNGSDGDISVHLETEGGTAASGVDFTPIDTDLSWANGESADKTVSIPIIDDFIIDPSEYFKVNLVNTTGGATIDPEWKLATVTIADDDVVGPSGQLVFEVASATVPEAAGILTFHVNRLDGTAGSVSVQVALTGGSATSGSDFTFDPVTLTFPDGATQASFNISIIDDALIESTETIKLELANVSGCVVGNPYQMTLHIRDNEGIVLPTVQFQQAAQTVNESAGSPSIIVTRTGDTSSTSKVVYALKAGGSATPGSDFIFIGSTLTFNPGVTQQSFNVNIINDTTPESDETIFLELKSPTGATLGTPAVSTITIQDNDALPLAVIRFQQGSYSVSESAGVVTINVQRGVNTSSTAQVFYALKSGGSATQGSDFNFANGSLTFNPEVTQLSFNVTIINDTTPEPDETIVLELRNPVNATLTTPLVSTITIQANDSGANTYIHFEQASYAVGERSGIRTINVIRSGDLSSESDVHYAWIGGSATKDSDFYSADGLLQFYTGQSLKSFDVTIYDDSLAELDETINFQLSGVTGAVITSPSNCTVTIQDDDAVGLPLVSFFQATYDVDESNGSLLVRVYRSGNTTISSTIDYAYIGGSATPGSDFSMSDGTLTFEPFETDKYIPITISNDSVPEDDETIELEIRNPVNATTVGAYLNTTVTIRDDDTSSGGGSGELVFESDSSTVNEDAGTVRFYVNRENGDSGEVSAEVTFYNGSAEQGKDFDFIPYTIHFPEGSIRDSFFVNIIDDPYPESDESFTLVLSGGSVGPTSQQTVTITDNDSTGSSFRFQRTPYSVPESAGVQTITVSRDGDTSSSAQVSYALKGGSATPDDDFSYTNGTLIFDPGVIEQSFTLTITDDSTYEPDETIELELKDPTPGTTLGTPSDLTITIQDNDIPVFPNIQFQQAEYSVNENGGQLTLMVTRTGDLSTVSQVEYFVKGGTALNGTDYTLSNGTLNFMMGMPAQTINISITDDQIDEPDETIFLELRNPVNASLGTPTVSTVTIIDNDDASLRSVQFQQAATSVNENGGQIMVTVTRTGDLSTTSQVEYFVKGGTALNGTDYTLSNGTLNFMMGMPAQTINISITDDQIDEPDETIFLELRNPVNASLGTPTVSTVTIIDNDDASLRSVQFQQAATSVNENGGQIMVTVTRTGDLSTTSQVEYFVKGGTALNGTDYTLSNGTLNFMMGMPAQTINISITDDQIDEPDETIFLELRNPVNASLGTPTVSTVTIIDNDDASLRSVQFQQAATSVNENGGQIMVTVTRTGDLSTTSQVEYFVKGGTALNGTDYTLSNGTLNFMMGMPAQTINISITDDQIDEPDETIFLELRNPVNASLGTPTVSTVTIIDNDNASLRSVQFQQAATSVNENGGQIMVTVTRTGDLSTTSQVEYFVKGGTALNGTDYTLSNGTLNFMMGMPAQTINISITDDQIDEPDETIFLELRNPVNASLGTPTVSTVTIIDNDDASLRSVQFQQAATSVNENGGQIMVTVTRTGDLSTTSQVEYFVKGGTALNGTDYTLSNGTLNFMMGMPAQTINISITDDQIDEPDETIFLELRNPVNASLGTPTVSTVTIIDNDDASLRSVQFQQAATSVNENGGQIMVTVTRTGDLSTTSQVEYFVKGGTALNGTDYTLSNGTLNFMMGMPAQTINISITDDQIDEPDETIFLELRNPVNASLGTPTVSTVTIIDNDDASLRSVQFQQAATSVNENGGQIMVTVTRTGDLSTTSQVEYFVKGGTALNGTDYTLSNGTLNFMMGMPAQTINISITDDQIDEPDETIFLELRNPVNASLGTPTVSTVTIIDNDDASLRSVQFQQAATSVNENGGQIMVTVTRTGDLSTTSQVEYFVKGGTALNGTDYTLSNGTLNFMMGMPAQTINISITDDQIDEPDETIFLELRNPVNASLGTPTVSTVTIIDNDDASLRSVQFQQAATSVNENGGQIMVTVTRTGDLSTTSQVEYFVKGGTALNGTDYTLSNGTLNFMMGMPAQTINISITDDQIDEPDETIFLELRNPVNASLGTPTVSTVTIIDNDDASLRSVQFQQAATSVNENGGQIMVTVTRTGDLSTTSQVEYFVKGGTALNGTDYTLSNGTLNFMMGMPAQTINISITDDQIDEPDETIFLELRNPVNASLGTPTVSTVTIIDNDDASLRSVQFQQAATSVNENGGQIMVTVTRTGDLSTTSQVEYFVKGGTALNGTDYTLSNGTLNFMMGMPAQTINISITDDQIDEPDETIFLELRNPVNASLGTPTVSTVTIIDNDDASLRSVQFQQAATSVNENGGQIMVTVTRTGDLSTTSQVEYFVKGGTALNGTDYTLSNGTLNFMMGMPAQTINISITDDQIDEPDETIFLELRNPVNASLGTPTVSTVTIIDNDDASLRSVQFQQAATSVNENGGQIMVTVTRTGDLSTTSQVEYFVKGGTALNGTDYTLSNGTLNFMMGMPAQTINISITDDQIDEPDETIFLELRNPVNASLGTPTVSTVTIIDNDPPANLPPTVDAGPNKSITLPVKTATLIGTATDDGQINPLVVTWRGPVGVTFNPIHETTTLATFPRTGVFTLTLEANDGEYTVTDTVTVVVLPSGMANEPPTVWINPVEYVIWPNSIQMMGGANDDGLLNDVLEVEWRKIEGPGEVGFGNKRAFETTALFEKTGLYVLGFSAYDGEFRTEAEIQFYVFPLPMVDAGDNQDIFINDQAQLTGRLENVDLPEALSNSLIHWSLDSGPGEAIFTNRNSLQNEVNFTKPGTYVLRLTIQAGMASNFDTVTIRVDAAPPGLTPVNKTFFNPKHESIIIPFEMNADGWVEINIYDIEGRLVKSLLNDWRGAGTNDVIWEGQNDQGEVVASGVYLVVFNKTGSLEKRKIAALK